MYTQFRLSLKWTIVAPIYSNRLLNTTIMPSILYILHTFDTLGSCYLDSQVTNQKNMIYSGQLVCKIVVVEGSF